VTTRVDPPRYSLEVRQAIPVIRKALMKDPSIVNELLKDQSHELAYTVLKQLSENLKQILEVNQAFQAAAKKLAEQQKAANEIEQRNSGPDRNQSDQLASDNQ
jgi:hypothetical protein